MPYPGTGLYEINLRRAGGYRQVSSDWSSYHQDGERVLKLKGLSRRRLRWLQHQAHAGFYLKNLRLADLARYLWRCRPLHSGTHKRKLGIKFVTKERFTG